MQKYGVRSKQNELSRFRKNNIIVKLNIYKKNFPMWETSLIHDLAKKYITK